MSQVVRPRSARRWVPSWVRRGGVLLATALVVEYVVIPQFAGARGAVNVLARVSPGFLVAGITVEVASLLCYSALTRSVLPSTGRPPLWTVLRIDISALGLSHVVPGGSAAATALRYRLLTLAGVDATEAVPSIAIEGTGVAAVLGVLCLAGLALAFPSARDDPTFLVAGTTVAVLLLAAAWVAVSAVRHRSRVVTLLRSVARFMPRVSPDDAERIADNLAVRLGTLAADRRLLSSAVTWAGGNWLLDAAALWVFLRAFGTDAGLEGLLLGYSLAQILAMLPVTPGGLGLVEGTLVSILVAFGAPHPEALIGVITWRLAEFWLPIPLSALAYLSLRTGTLRPQRLPPRPLIPRPDADPLGRRT